MADDQNETDRDADDVLTPRQVAEMFGVNPKTISRWSRVGKLQCFRTIGGHRRYQRSEVEAVKARLIERGESSDG